MPKLLRYKNFWLHPEKTINHFFLPLFSKVFNDEVLLTNNFNDKVDIELISVFKPKTPKLQRISRKIGIQPEFLGKVNKKQFESNSTKKVWFSGENKRPPFQNSYDAYLGYDQSDISPSFIYLPLWVLNLNWFGEELTHDRLNKVSDQTSLLQKRNISSSELSRRKFCCIFANNPENLRMEMIHQLKKIGEVDIFGGVANNFVKDKLAVGKNYRFIISFENTLYPGYVTEKLLEAYETTAFPLYWGLDRDGYFNTDSFLNFANFPNFKTFMMEVERLNKNLDELARKINQPLLQREFLQHNVVTDLQKILCV